MVWLELGIQIGLPLALLSLGLIVGRILEKRHYASIRHREKELAGVLVFSTRWPPEVTASQRTTLVAGSVVISSDHFKTFVAGLRNIFGGNVRSYETLLDRARREAVLRLKEEAHRQGAQLVIGLRFETTQISGRGTPCMEVLAYGTALTPTAPGTHRPDRPTAQPATALAG
jgi:uncharacterized protein YbjQ (UPF0145 family)